uniref:Transient receptor potential-gamma protein n=1 Tax=Magallana gigas TaxID=29159 RepID=K1S2W3_MAGGI
MDSSDDVKESVSGTGPGTNADARQLDPNSETKKMDKVYYQYREKLMNQGRFIDPDTDLEGDSFGMGVVRKEMDLTNDEKQYLLAVERGDVPSTRQYLSMGVQTGLNVNCVDPLGRSALLIAIENENIEMIEVLLNYNVEVGDSLLHAINEENVEAVELILNHEVATKGEESRRHERFVSHPNCQQLLASLWYEGLPGFRRHNIVSRLLITFMIGFTFPLLSLFYLIAPKSRFGKLIRKPFIKFICHSASYITFLVLLILVSQRVEIPIPGLWDKVATDLDKIQLEQRGAPATMVEWMILAYVAGLIWAEIKQLWDEGAHDYVHDMWNILDFVTNSLYIATFTLRLIAYLQVQKEIQENKASAQLERKDWNAYDPNLIAESLFAAANIFSSLKLIYIFTVNPHLGPLQISLGRMILDIMKFAVLYGLVLFSFACGLNHLYWYYATLRERECKVQNIEESCDRRYKRFANLFQILQTLYWSIYGLIDLNNAELLENHIFTEFIGKLMFGSYSWIALVVLLNLLIAMMSNSYHNTSSQADEEWKFARSKLWMSYFEDSGTLPAPFNIIPSPKSCIYLLLWFKRNVFSCSLHQKRNRWQSIRKIVKKINEKEIRYQRVMRDLIKRYIMQKQRGPLRGEGVTEDDVQEIKQDISSFRYELLEILRNNGMKTPNPNQPKPTNRRSYRRRNQVNLERLKRTMTMGTIKESNNKNGNPDQVLPDKNPQGTAAGEKKDKEGTASFTFLEKPDNLRRRSPRRGIGSLRTDEGLGESLDLNIENENSPKMDHHSIVGDAGGVKEGLAACLSPSMACNPEIYDAYSGVPKSPARRVTFL